MPRIAERCMESVFRVLINLTHDSSIWCRTLYQGGEALYMIVRIIVASNRHRAALLIKKEPDEDPLDQADGDMSAQVLDRLCLALGLLTNLVQADDTTSTACRTLCT